MRTLLVLVLWTHIAAAEEPAEEKTLLAAYAITVASTSLPAVAGGLVAGDDARGTPGHVAGVLGAASLLLGPSTGHWYVGETWTTGLTLRICGAGVLGAMVLREQQAPLETGTLIVGGIAVGGLIGAGMLWDLVTLPSAVRDANRARLVVAPTANGISVAGRF